MIDLPGYAPGSGDYRARCADVDLALTVARERIEEWNRDTDPHGWWHERSVLIALHNAAVRRPVSDATLDDIATMVAAVRVMAVRLEALSTVLVDDDPQARAGWGDVLDDMRTVLVSSGNALFYAHLRETGTPPPMYLSTQPARRCRYPVADSPEGDGVPVECGEPSGWRSLASDGAAVYACENHEVDLRVEAAAVGAAVERLPV